MSNIANQTKKYYIHSILTVIFMFSGWVLPPMFGLPVAGMKALGIFIGMLWGWIFVEFAWVSLLGIVMLGMIGVISVPQALLMSFGTDMFLQLFFSMVFVIYIELSGFATWFAKWMLKLDFIKGHAWRLIGAYLLLASVLMMFINSFAVIFLVWAFFKETAAQCGYKKEDFTVAYVLMGVAMMTTVAPSILPFRTYPVMLQGILSGLGSTGVPFIQWVICAVIAFLYTFFGYLLIGKFIFKLDVSKLNNLSKEFENENDEKLTFEMKLAVGLLIVFVLILSLAALLPAGPIKAFFNGFGLQGTAAIMVVLLLAYRKKDGTRLVTLHELVSRGVSWDSLFLLCSTLTLAAVFKMPEVGIVQALTTGLLPYIQNLSPMVFMIACCIIFWLVTQVTHNMVIILVLVGALSEVLLAAGANPWAFAFMFTLACQFAYATPAASAFGAVGYGEEWIGRKNAYKIGIAFTLLAIPFFFFMTPLTITIMGPFVP